MKRMVHMKRKSIGKIAVLLAVLMLGFSATACSSKDDTASTAPKTTITMTMWDTMPKNENFVQEFMNENPDINVQIIQIPGDSYSQKINTMVSSNTAADVMLLYECDMPVLANAGKIISLDKYISSATQFKANDLIPAVTSLSALNGATYGLPWCYANEILYYNKDMFDAAHVSYPNSDWTWDDFRQAAQKLTITKDGKTTQWGTDAITDGVWYSLIGSYGDDIVGKNITLSLGDGAKKALQFEDDLVNKYKVSPVPSSTTNQNDLFSSSQAAMTERGSWLISSYKDLGFKWDISVLPKGTTSYSSMHTGFFSISKQSKNQDAAWKFVEFCMGDKGQEMIEKGFNNISTRKSVAEKGAYQLSGTNGPSNWDVMTQTSDFAKIGYVLLPSGVTSDLITKFQAAVSGQESVDQALSEGIAQAQQTMGS